MPPPQPYGPAAPSRSRAHRILAVIVLAGAAAQGMSWLLGEPGTGIAVAALPSMGAAFLGADVLDARGRARDAILLTCLAILVAVPAMALLLEPGAAAMLLPSVAFILALPHLRGRSLAALGVGGVVMTAFAASIQMILDVPGNAGGTSASNTLAVLVGVAGITTVLFVLAWQVDRAREAASGRYAGLLGELPIGVSRTDTSGRLLEVNEAYARMLGFADPAAAVGTMATDLVVDPGALLRVVAELDTRREVVSQVQARRRDGATLWTRLTSRAVRDGHGVVRWYDTVTEDVTAERRISDDEARLAAIVETCDLSIVSVALDGRIMAWNGGAERILGWTDRDAEISVYDVSPREEWDWIRANHARAAQGETMGPFEIERVHRGKAVNLAVTVFPIRDADGTVSAIANVGRDITAEVRLRAERARLEDQLLEAQRLEATGRLAGGIAHDFNNHLTAIRGYGSELLGELRPGSSAHDAAEQILRSSAQASQLTHQLLAFARRQVLQPEVVDLDLVIAEQVPTLRRLVGGAIQLIVDSAPVPAPVMADRTQLVEVLLHLALNAREAMPDGGTIRIVTRVAPASVGLEPAGGAGGQAPTANEVVLRFEDTGRGIAPEVLPHVFEPFFTTKEMGRGTGLGLSMVHGVVRQSGGRIEAESGSRGTAMVIRLPLASSLPAPTPPAVPGRRVDGGRILLVDDDPVVRTVARRILEHAGFDTLEASDAARARAIVEGDPGPIDLLVTDVIMPGMRGPDLARLLHETDADLPVLFVSGYADGDELADLGTGHAAFLAKPFSVDELLRAVRDLLVARPEAARAGGAATGEAASL